MEIERLLRQVREGEPRAIARAITLVENQRPEADQILAGLDRQRIDDALVLGVTGPPGAGKSTLTGQLVGELRKRDFRVGIVAIDPSSSLSGGALLGDRIRMMQHTLDRDVVIRSMATRGRLGGLCISAGAAARIMASSGCRVVVLETVGTGQSEMDVCRLADLTILVLAPGFGDDIQAMKAGILEVADLVVINKSDQVGAEKLRLEMGTIFSDPRERERRICSTVASEGAGIGDLLERVFFFEDSYRSDGRFLKRRNRSFRSETLDRALELVRERLQVELTTASLKSKEPLQAARELLQRLDIDEEEPWHPEMN